MDFFHRNKKTLLTSAVIILCVGLFAAFPARGIFEEIVKSATFLFIIPALYITLVLKEPMRHWGFFKGSFPRHTIIFSVALFFAGLLFLLLALSFTDFARVYALPLSVQTNFWLFVLYELLFVGLFAALYEFFFRGFVQGAFEQTLGWRAMLIQFVVVFGTFAILEPSLWHMIPFLLSAIVAGMIKYWTRSLYWAFTASFLLLLLTDVLVISALR